MRAAAPLGPNARIPASKHASTSPATSGASGPTTTRSQSCSRAVATIPAMSSAATSRQTTLSRAIPAFPGAARISGCCGLRRSARTSACSRPPLPTTRTRFGVSLLEGRDEVVHRDRGEGLVATGPPRPELERDAGDGLLVRSLQHVDEVVLAERCPLRRDGGAELLDLLVDLADAGGVVLQGRDPLWREGREQDVGRHGRYPSTAGKLRAVRDDELLRPWWEQAMALVPDVEIFDAHTHVGGNDPDGFKA